MMKEVSIAEKLLETKIKSLKLEDELLNEAHRILNESLFSDKNVLNNLHLYNQSYELVNEEGADVFCVFNISTIKNIAINYGLKFIDSQVYKNEIPYEAILRIKHLNLTQRKDLRNFKILAPKENFVSNTNDKSVLLFAPTNHGNYYLIHKWGEPLKWYRKISSWPLRRFETLFASVAIISLLIAISLPTRLIWLPQHADYWGMYRLGAFFHILIFNLGFTAYGMFAFRKNFNSSTWNSKYNS